MSYDLLSPYAILVINLHSNCQTTHYNKFYQFSILFDTLELFLANGHCQTTNYSGVVPHYLSVRSLMYNVNDCLYIWYNLRFSILPYQVSFVLIIWYSYCRVETRAYIYERLMKMEINYWTKRFQLWVTVCRALQNFAQQIIKMNLN